MGMSCTEQQWKLVACSFVDLYSRLKAQANPKTLHTLGKALHVRGYGCYVLA